MGRGRSGVLASGARVATGMAGDLVVEQRVLVLAIFRRALGRRLHDVFAAGDVAMGRGRSRHLPVRARVGRAGGGVAPRHMAMGRGRSGVLAPGTRVATRMAGDLVVEQGVLVLAGAGRALRRRIRNTSDVAVSRGRCHSLASGARVGRAGGGVAPRHMAMGRGRSGVLAPGTRVATRMAGDLVVEQGVLVLAGAGRALRRRIRNTSDVAVSRGRCHSLASGARVGRAGGGVAPRHMAMGRGRSGVLAPGTRVATRMAVVLVANRRSVAMLAAGADHRRRLRRRARVVVVDPGSVRALLDREMAARRTVFMLQKTARLRWGLGRGLGGRRVVGQREHQPGGQHQQRHRQRQPTPQRSQAPSPVPVCSHLGGPLRAVELSKLEEGRGQTRRRPSKSPAVTNCLASGEHPTAFF